MDHLRAVELRHLRQFVAVAEERHFGRAAQRLFLSQPSLSHSVKQLESLLGVALLDREDRRRVRVTPAGEALLAYVRELEVQLQSGLRAVQSLGARGVRLIRVGYNDGEPLSQRPAALRAGMKETGLPVMFRRLQWGQEAAALRRGEVDVLLARLPIDLHRLEHQVLFAEPRQLCVPAGHRLARRKQVRLSELRDLKIVQPMGGSPAWQDYWRGMPRADGSVPPVGPEVHSPEETFDAVLSGQAACFVPASMAPQSAGGPVRFVTVTDLQPSELAVVWSGKPRSWLNEFIAAASSLCDRLASGPALRT